MTHFGKNWRDAAGDIVEFRRSPETRMPEWRWSVISGAEQKRPWNSLFMAPAIDAPLLLAALFSWARASPARAKTDWVAEGCQMKWDADLIGDAFTTKPVEMWFDERCHNATFRRDLRLWIAQTRPEMLPPPIGVHVALGPEEIDEALARDPPLDVREVRVRALAEKWIGLIPESRCDPRDAEGLLWRAARMIDALDAGTVPPKEAK